MAMTQSSVVIGVFPTQAQAQQALQALRNAGFGDEEIGFLSRAEATQNISDVSAGAASGVMEGGIVGGLLGAAVALFIPGFGPALAGGIVAATLGGLALGAGAGGILGMLRSIGVNENEVRFYQDELAANHVIITVKVSSSLQDAEAILRTNGATAVRVHDSVVTSDSHMPPDPDQ
jgi:uncharacterized membrane protein